MGSGAPWATSFFPIKMLTVGPMNPARLVKNPIQLDPVPWNAAVPSTPPTASKTLFSPLLSATATMSSEPPPSASTPADADELASDPATATLSKKQQKKDARKAEKAEKAAQRQQQQQAVDAEDPFAPHYCYVPVEEIQSKALLLFSYLLVWLYPYY
jgi:hypothetical protein